MALALFHGSMSRSRKAATWAPTKFGMRPCGGNGKRATPSALSLSQTHCRAALLSAKSRAMTESGAAHPGDSQAGPGAWLDFTLIGRDVNLVSRIQTARAATRQNLLAPICRPT